MEKKGTGKFPVRVWGWPTLIFYALYLVLVAVFKLTSPDRLKHFLEPDSGREVLFVSLLGFLFIVYLWVLICRYSKMLEKKLSFIAKWGTVFLAVMVTLGIVCNLIRYLLQGQVT